MQFNTKEVLTIQECADYMECSVRAVRNYISQNKLRYFKIGSRYRVRRDNLESFSNDLSDKRDNIIPPAKHSSIVYFVVNGEYVKIGTTENLGNRIRHLSNSSPTRIRVVLKLDGDRTLEKLLHARFSRYRHNLEWFRLSDEIKSFIASGGHEP